MKCEIGYGIDARSLKSEYEWSDWNDRNSAYQRICDEASVEISKRMAAFAGAVAGGEVSRVRFEMTFHNALAAKEMPFVAEDWIPDSILGVPTKVETDSNGDAGDWWFNVWAMAEAGVPEDAVQTPSDLYEILTLTVPTENKMRGFYVPDPANPKRTLDIDGGPADCGATRDALWCFRQGDKAFAEEYLRWLKRADRESFDQLAPDRGGRADGWAEMLEKMKIE